MICRMSRSQRDLLILLMDTIIEEKLDEENNNKRIQRRVAEENFHQSFKIEHKSEDKYDHTQ